MGVCVCVCEATLVSSETIREIRICLRREVAGVCVRVCVCVCEATLVGSETPRELRILSSPRGGWCLWGCVFVFAFERQHW